eukprot:gnl/TRDRNA2_/TRDRNA2_173950_c1_seq1.p2 gnl/TRDRNA2_/TRDRNA2_173950_c1~~gnl/TRDRNA2_/TRDRNA2_173950_c1_seq1.p2  ORF type:complete len:117 (+),score=9.04 gnl/TRDRNA2_/TRDRNA2_173950_c1_seq1:340-690(+)
MPSFVCPSLLPCTAGFRYNFAASLSLGSDHHHCLRTSCQALSARLHHPVRLPFSPFQSLCIAVSQAAITVFVHHAEMCLCVCIALCGCLLVPFYSLCIGLGQTNTTGLVHHHAGGV